ncbi:MAG: DNA translocase FtsK 4TM domain-containing protein [Acidobacteriota bacterium]|jgi:S-DNA-T family DNA segregation ATPase FtsK/SpoIIIE|nr:DNA translocase FtsK 4TM domain-containing protein [Acidobacteriota bacterium]
MMPSEPSDKRHEVVGVLLLICALLLFLCLVGYDHQDASFNSLSGRGEGALAKNIVGRAGAYASDLLYQCFGFAAFLLLLPLLMVGGGLVVGRGLRPVYIKVCGFLLLLFGCATALQLFVPAGQEPPAFMPGGVTGTLIADFLLPNLNRTGSVIVVAGSLLLGVLGTTSWSIAKGISRFSSTPNPPRPSLRERFRRWREKHKARRTVVSIKPPASTRPLELTPRPEPVKTAPDGGAQQTVPVIRQEAPQTVERPYTPPPRPVAPPAEEPDDFEFPPLDLLKRGEEALPVDEAELMERARLLTAKCAEFDAGGQITQIHPGPVVTTFEFKPDPGVKVAKITGLVDDLCLGIKAESLRIERLPGKATIGIEAPNDNHKDIMLRDLLEADVFTRSRSKLTLALGKDINGTPYVTDLSKMPHLLIAGATGTGKSVALNCLITSILYKATPREVRFIFIDPKTVELALYKDIPHLLTPIVTDPGEAANALRWAVNEMELRYKKLARRGVRNIDQYNERLRSPKLWDESEAGGPDEPLPFLVLVIDELADLMAVSAREVETSIARLGQKARAAGIHMILATQRPSVDVINGTIKNNLPSRIAFKVTAKVDSRTILDCNGAEQLLGKGDMLFLPPGTSRLVRIHGAYVSEKETQAIVEHLKEQGTPAYDDSVLRYGEDGGEGEGALDGSDGDAAVDPIYNDAVRVVVSDGRASTSLLQRRLSVGYGRAAKLVDMMFKNGIVGPADGSKPREVLVGFDYLERLDEMRLQGD